MLKLIVALTEGFDDSRQAFVATEQTTLKFEHSLLTLSKWESVFEKAFLGNQEKTMEETQAYIHMMCVDGEIPPEVFSKLTKEHFDQINKYINAKMTATNIQERPGSRPSRETITSELIYFWMISFNIPFQCETWHLERLLILIRVCNAKTGSHKKMNRQELASRNRSLNADRKAKLGTSG